MPRTVLIVDDEASHREALANMLQKEYALLQAENGADALSVLYKHYTEISAVLLDLCMPEADGYEVLQKIQKNFLLNVIPVIVVTALTDGASEEKALRYGAYGFVRKPYDPAVIRHHLTNAIALRETATANHMLRRDGLTNLYNKRGFDEQAAVMLRTHAPGYYVVAAIDIDGFRQLNERYGAEKGDMVLRHVGRTVDRCMATLDGICCRIHADRFAAMYPAVYQDTDTVRQCREEALAPHCIARPIRLRIGRCVAGDASLPVEQLYERAAAAADALRGGEQAPDSGR